MVATIIDTLVDVGNKEDYYDRPFVVSFVSLIVIIKRRHCPVQFSNNLD
jgi:hypothetical protein